MTLFILLPWYILGDLGLGFNSADIYFTWSPSQTKQPCMKFRPMVELVVGLRIVLKEAGSSG